MRKLALASSLALAMFVAGCGGNDDPIVESVKLKVNQPKTADSGQLTLTMTKFVDSRCPRNVQCVTAGSAVIDVTLAASGSSPATVQMTLGAAGGPLPTYTYGRYQLEFVDLVPYPEGSVLVITDSEATIVVRRD